MTAISTARQDRAGALNASEAQAEVFWLAFQALPEAAQQAVRKRLLHDQELPPMLVAELESWQAAAAEALMDFEAMFDKTQ
ncbi:MAG: hypothetical protein ACK47M_19920 [Caldilinea sp.]